jgi:hypothetical protein
MTTEAKAYHWPCGAAEYHAETESVSRSQLEVFLESPELYHAMFVTGEVRKEATAAMDFGTVFHDVVLGPPFVVDRENFCRYTVATFRPWNSYQPSDDTLIHTSETGSVYYDLGHGVVRGSDHWGRVGGCYWAYAGPTGDPSDPGWKRMRFGYCAYQDFLYQEGFVPIPRDVLNKDGHRKGGTWTQFEEANKGKILLKEEEFGAIPKMIAQLKAHSKSAAILNHPKRLSEHTIVWQDDDTGLTLRCRLDLGILDPAICIADLKCMANVDRRFVATQLYRMGYHRQAAFYQMGVEALIGKQLPFVFIAIHTGKETTHQVEVIGLSDRFMELGRQQVRAGLNRLLKARQKNHWRAPSHGQIVIVDPPNYALYGDDLEMTSDVE